MHGMAPIEVAALKDCVELLSDSVYELKRSLEEMNQPGSKSLRLVMSDLQTWVSAAMTNEDTCIEGFANTKMKNVVRGKIVNVAHLTSNALALINSYATLSKQQQKQRKSQNRGLHDHSNDLGHPPCSLSTPKGPSREPHATTLAPLPTYLMLRTKYSMRSRPSLDVAPYPWRPLSKSRARSHT
ncbi:hypothetical protein L6452_14647 [Arctium lappa]|uniref:Uncharacterized protein n=1 Tax=Arctium lappa TaxID=4217 RepID=A0ACB9CLK7_ARCLA|nr:hypothetical protein L6452_14647 [Arctium lappa]